MFIGSIFLTLVGVFFLAQRTAANEGKSQVTPDSTVSYDEADLVVPITPGGQGSGEGDDSQEGQSGSQQSHDELNDSGTRPPTPMPMSLQYHSLAMSDLYHAIREGLTTPERSTRPNSATQVASERHRRGSAVMARAMQGIPETKEVTMP